MGSIGEMLKKRTITNFHNIKHTFVQFISNADESSNDKSNESFNEETKESTQTTESKQFTHV